MRDELSGDQIAPDYFDPVFEAEENGAPARAEAVSQQLGDQHFFSFAHRGSTLLVTFETADGAPTPEAPYHPVASDLAEARNWSQLGVASHGETWFRDPEVFDLFDQLADSGFFDGFDQIVFYGAGAGGYAAAAFSVAAPGATVLALRPQATLDPRLAGWDQRFAAARRISFGGRYGYAPDMMDAATQAFILYDPQDRMDAAHAAMFARPHVVLLRMPHMGQMLEQRLREMGIFEPVLSMATTATLTAPEFHRLFRARRDSFDYLFNLLAKLNQEKRMFLKLLLCQNVASRMPKRFKARRFRRQLARLENEIRKGEVQLPPSFLSAYSQDTDGPTADPA